MLISDIDDEDHENAALDQRVIARADGGDQQPPETGISKHRLGHDSAADEIRHHETDDRHERQQSIAQNVPTDDIPFRRPLERAVRT